MAYNIPERYAIMIVVGHGNDNFIPESFTSYIPQYPTNSKECIEQNEQQLLFPPKILNNIYVSNIAPLGYANKSSPDPTQITSRFMKTNILNGLFNHYHYKIIERIIREPHDPTVLAHNQAILELFFSNSHLGDFLQMFDRAALADFFTTNDHTVYKHYMDDFQSRRHAGTIMPLNVAINSEIILSESPSTIYTNPSQLIEFPHDEYSGVFLAFTDVFKVTPLFDITLFETWRQQPLLEDTIKKYITKWNQYGSTGFITTNDVKITNFHTINMYHIVFLILDWENARQNFEQMSIDYLLARMCSSFTLKMYINSFTCRVATYDNDELKSMNKSSNLPLSRRLTYLKLQKQGPVQLTRSQRDKATLIITSNINKLKGIPKRQINELKTLKKEYKETEPNNEERKSDILKAITKITNELPITARGISIKTRKHKRKTRKQRRKEDRERKDNKKKTRANRQHRRRNHSRK